MRQVELHGNFIQDLLVLIGKMRRSKVAGWAQTVFNFDHELKRMEEDLY